MNNVVYDIEDFFNIPCQKSIPIKAFSPQEATEEIKKVNPHKSSGQVLITDKIVKQLPIKAIVLIKVIYNSILRLLNYSTSWKFAQLIKVSKQGKPVNETISYKPISLLPIMFKIFDKLLLK